MTPRTVGTIGTPCTGGFPAVVGAPVPGGANPNTQLLYDVAPANDSYDLGKFATLSGGSNDWLRTPTIPPPGPRTRPQSARPVIGSR
jgi:hypothetical protein